MSFCVSNKKYVKGDETKVLKNFEFNFFQVVKNLILKNIQLKKLNLVF